MMLNDLLQLDLDLFHLINGQWHHPWLDAIMPLWRDKKTWIPFYVLLAGYLFDPYKIRQISVFFQRKRVDFSRPIV